MKKNLLFGACMLSLLAGVSSCSNDEVADNNGAAGKQISITAGISNGAEMRVAYEDDGNSKVTVSWSASETFTMYQGTGSAGTEFSKSTAGNVFSGTLPTGSGTYYGVYGTGITNADGVLAVDLSSQVGTNAENGIKEFMVAEATDLNQSMTFAHKLAVLKLTLTLPDVTATTVDTVSISGMHNKAGYDLSAKTYSYIEENKGEIVATGDAGNGFTISDGKKITAYIAVFPETVAAEKIEITAQVGTGYYGYTLKSEKTLVAGEVTPVSVGLTEKKINFRKEYAVSDYYRWDAYCGLGVGSADEFSENNSGYNPEGVASHSCASCPTAQEMVNYIAAGCYWDDGSDGEGKISCTVPTGNDGNSTKEVTKGLWLLKKAYITSAGPTHIEDKIFSGASYMTNFSSLDADEIKYIRTSGKYFFLPAAGEYTYYDLGDSGIISRFDGTDISGCYWSSTVGRNAHFLYFFSNVNGSAVNVSYGSRDGGGGMLPMVAE